MKMPDNTLISAANYFKDELKGLYDASELQQMLNITFQYYFGVDRIELNTNTTKLLSESDLLKIIYTVKDLKKHKPLAYIIGIWEFYGLTIKVNEHTLIPRPETEELVQLIINDTLNEKITNVLDIGTGSGCIALALKKHLDNVKVSAWDISEDALKVAKENALLNNLEVNFNNIDILAVNPGCVEKWDVIVSNPPYIPQNEKIMMHRNVLDFEPHLALFVEDGDALLFYNVIADYGSRHLVENGKLYFEINENYADQVKKMMIRRGYSNVSVLQDINGKNRMVRAIFK